MCDFWCEDVQNGRKRSDAIDLDRQDGSAQIKLERILVGATGRRLSSGQVCGQFTSEHDQADEVTGIDAPLAAADEHVFGKTRVDAQRHRFHARDESHDVVEIVLTTLFFPRSSQPRARRIHRFALAELAEGVLDGVDLFSAADFSFGRF